MKLGEKKTSVEKLTVQEKKDQKKEIVKKIDTQKDAFKMVKEAEITPSME